MNSLIESISPRFLEREKLVPVVSITAATVILFSSYKCFWRKTKERGIKEIPIPGSRYPYFGHMFSLGTSPGKVIAAWHRELGPLIQLCMGIQTWIMVDDPVLAHKIFVSNGAVASNRPHVTFAYDYYGLKGKGIVFGSHSKNWKKARGAVLSIIAPKVVDKNYIKPIQSEAAALVDRLIAYSKKENGVDPTVHLHLNSMNTICRAAFGKHYSFDDPEFKTMSHVTERSMTLAAMEQDLPNFLPIMTVVDYLSGKHAMMKDFINNERNPLYRKLIAEALETPGPNFVKSLDAFNFTEEERLVITADLINGGTDTVSVTLSWSFVIMCHYPLAQKKAADEIDAFIKLNGRLPEFSERTQLPYCVSMMKEGMRFRPIGPFGIPHTLDADVLVDGYLISKGSIVISSMESMHQNPDVFSEPLRYYPERFMNNLKTMDAAAKGKIEERDHFNFGWGRRMCPAIYMAEVEFFTSFTQILSKCTIEPVRDANGKEQLPDIDHPVTAGLTLLPIPYKVNFVERTDSLI
ncbi:cytochrome P450 [Mucor mucedo]|uniref:cytochrome P450 n=1 Tax=Mucor mucedo TaxID=29922 RepID=UPI00221E95F9|nr:cytochrome P450 [Mucor mucedo]KAI7879545.1 cytochrome P450 [Mucor mucedo]